MTLLSRLAPAVLLVAFPTFARAADPNPEKAAVLEWLRVLDADVAADRDGNVTDVQFGCGVPIHDNELILLKAFPRLEKLTIIGDDDITDAGLAHLKGMKLKKLFLVSEKVTAKGLKSIAGLEGLEDLHLNRVPVSAAGLDELKKLKNLKSLWIRGSGLADADASSFAGFAKLETLRLNNKMTDAGLEKVKAMLPKAHVMR